LRPRWLFSQSSSLALSLLTVVILTLSSLGLGAASAAGNIHWKPVPGAMMRLAGHPVRIWNIFQGDKKGKLFLLQLGHRVLIVDLQQHVVYGPPPADFPGATRDDEFQGRGPVSADRRIPTIDWTERDVGPAELIQVTLNDYGQLLELQIPHPPDYRGGRY
jgi:hypothetical protein